MNEEILELKTEADKIMARSGKSKGGALKSDKKFILIKQGEAGLGKLEESLALLGYPFSYEDVKGYEWYQEAQSVLGIYVATKLFSWESSDVFEMGYGAPATSPIIATLMRFVSLEKTLSQASSIWGKTYDFGELSISSFDKENKRGELRISGYPFFDYMKDYFDGFFSKITALLGLGSAATIESRWCEEGDHSCRIFEVRW